MAPVLATLLSATLNGITGRVVRVEVDVAPGLPGFTIVGLPDAALSEARERVRGALRNAGYHHPPRRITVNLAPGGAPEGRGLARPRDRDRHPARLRAAPRRSGRARAGGGARPRRRGAPGPGRPADVPRTGAPGRRTRHRPGGGHRRGPPRGRDRCPAGGHGRRGGRARALVADASCRAAAPAPRDQRHRCRARRGRGSTHGSRRGRGPRRRAGPVHRPARARDRPRGRPRDAPHRAARRREDAPRPDDPRAPAGPRRRGGARGDGRGLRRVGRAGQRPRAPSAGPCTPPHHLVCRDGGRRAAALARRGDPRRPGRAVLRRAARVRPRRPRSAAPAARGRERVRRARRAGRDVSRAVHVRGRDEPVPVRPVRVGRPVVHVSARRPRAVPAARVGSAPRPGRPVGGRGPRPARDDRVRTGARALGDGREPDRGGASPPGGPQRPDCRTPGSRAVRSGMRAVSRRAR